MQANPTGAKADKLLAEYEQYRTQVEIIKQNLELINSSLVELQIVKGSFDQIKGLSKGSEILVPLGGDSFVKASIADTENVIVGMGAEVAVKKPVSEASEDVEARIKELEKLREEQEQKMHMVLRKLEEFTPQIQSIVSQLRKEG